jgi:hypothetical protein
MKHGRRTDGLTRKAGEEENRNGKGAKQGPDNGRERSPQRRRDTEEAKRKTERKNVNHRWARMNTDKENRKEREQEEATTGIQNRH